MSEIQRGELVPAVLGGRAANGHERDKGEVVHAVKVIQPKFLDLSAMAACGKRHGPRSIGFVARTNAEVTCKKCIKEMAKISAWAVCDPYVVKGPSLLAWFDTEEQASEWLKEQTKADESGYVGCVVLPKASALQYA